MYLDKIKQVPAPTLQSIGQFVANFCQAHSWYKHFGRNEPSPVIFFLDPNASRPVVIGPIPHKGGAPALSFGPPVAGRKASLWRYYSDRYTKNHLTNENGELQNPNDYLGLNVLAEDGSLFPVPGDVAALGTIGLTAYIHESFSRGREKEQVCHQQEKERLRNHLIDVWNHLRPDAPMEF
ncbi:hypothetical protein [Flaviaesturariibacter aridisoli]|uniref:Uncharacterized protein n=1 Tax=Flaviaesturariibacter aridisoli TaxID=2545761 RepID=A0A4R4E3A0_9BACT|nr:hypothetical protein [Flaviaesturariibacter aridisoli]TCZ73283.1 hypothetical protein E0486_06310 [Flaviaesturariibacter aridisoli]